MRKPHPGARAAHWAFATAVLAIVMLANALTVSATSTAETASVISVHTEGTVVPLPGDSYTNVASLFLPMGTWLLVAKADFVNVDDTAHSIKCRLVAGGQADVTETGLTKETGGPFRRTLFSVLPRHVASVNGGTVVWSLQCSSHVGAGPDDELEVATATPGDAGSFESAASTAAGTIGTQSLNNTVEFICPAFAGPPAADVRARFIRSVYLKTDSLTDAVF